MGGGGLEGLSVAKGVNGGGPSIRSEANALLICERIASGESLRSICLDPSMPSPDAVRVWLGDDLAFQAQYAKARADQAEHYAQEIVEIADDLSDDPASRRVRIDARKWVACKLLPRKYGDKVQLDAQGGGVLVMLSPTEALL